MKTNTIQPVLRGYARTVCDRQWKWRNHGGSSAEHVLWLIESGSGAIKINGTMQPVRAGECLLIPMWHDVEGIHEDDTPFVVLWAVFALCDQQGSPVDLRRPENVDLHFPLRRFLPETVFFQRLFTRLLASGDKDEREDYLRVMLRELRYQDSFVHTQGMDPETYRQISSICADIRTNPGKNWQVAEMAHNMHYSPDHFSRIFRQATGQRPLDYLIERRIETARGLLSYSSNTINHIAHTLGYCDVYHFCRQFKQKTGITPLQQRRARQAK